MAALEALRRLGVTAEILTGDATAPTIEVSNALGHLPFHAHMSPEQKLAHIETLRRRGAHIAMVGDGINDVPGLAAAAVAIAPAEGTDLAKSRSDAILLSGGLMALPRAIALARRS
ncbi:MAG: HAD-IC family P-type ATPase, partial [Gammaproteobacteria bacterium]|nr:HAD-IC family P-type ATPase [Gammaproteobacteria bacterium]